jgi:hypothetical protein
LRLWEERERLVEILLVNRLRILEVGWKFFIVLVACDCGVAFAIDGTESYIAATDEGIELSSLKAVSLGQSPCIRRSYQSSLGRVVICH